MSAKEIVVAKEVAAFRHSSGETIQSEERREGKVSKQVLALQKFWQTLRSVLSDEVQIEYIRKNIIKLLNSSLTQEERDECFLMLCRRALWLDAVCNLQQYSFFAVAVENLQFGSEKLQKTQECLYFRMLIRLKKDLTADQLQDRTHDRYTAMSAFDSVVQKAKFAPKDREKAYQWANTEMERILEPENYNKGAAHKSYNEEASEKFWTELSSEGEMGKTRPYLLGRVAGYASIGLGVTLIVASAVSLVGSLGVSAPLFLPTLWLSWTLIGVGLAAIAGGTTAKNVAATPYKKAREVREDWNDVRTSVKAAFWSSPKPEPSRRTGIDAADLIGGICAVMGTLGI